MENKVISKEYVDKNYISKNEIKRLQSEIHQLLDENGIARAYQLTIDRYFNELLEDK